MNNHIDYKKEFEKFLRFERYDVYFEGETIGKDEIFYLFDRFLERMEDKHEEIDFFYGDDDED